ncbi:MAG: hypothetical protein WAP57_05935, partial [Aquabacterium commune]|uniref:hypothetical protein n=1 Tax=Aquabacterium commune TaxID=70586 RepID=UPI003BB0FB65
PHQNPDSVYRDNACCATPKSGFVSLCRAVEFMLIPHQNPDTPSELVAQFDQSSDQRLRDLVAQCVVGLIVPDDLTAHEFAQWVHDIRHSHIEWNRALGQALLDAEDARANGHKNVAMHLLTEFAAQCAWLPLKGIAESEAQRFRSL